MKFIPFYLTILAVALTLNAVIIDNVNADTYNGGYATKSAIKDPMIRSEIMNQHYYNMYKKPFNSTADSNIVGGGPADDNEFPWFGRVEIFFFKGDGGNTSSQSCGASLIYKDVAVSAAHCMVDRLVAEEDVGFYATLYLGANNYNGSDGTPYTVSDIVWPTTYPKDLIEDILYLILETPTDVNPVQYNSDPDFPTPGTIGTAIGFGNTSLNSGPSSVLLKVDLPTISDEDCATAYGGKIPDVYLCAYDPNQPKGTCYGDSGGPIISTDGIIFGITSFGGDTCTDKPSGFTRTSFFREFTPRVFCDFSNYPEPGCKSFPLPCGLFGLSIFCPLTFGGIIGRLLRSIYTLLLG